MYSKFQEEKRYSEKTGENVTENYTELQQLSIDQNTPIICSTKKPDDIIATPYCYLRVNLLEHVIWGKMDIILLHDRARLEIVFSMLKDSISSGAPIEKTHVS